MRKIVIFALAVASIGGSILVPTQSFAAYTCMNPAICRAVCGAPTCGQFTARDADMRALDAPAAKLAATPGKPAAGKTYTCMNPAICRAVCGSSTCGTP